jgi:hypothetical protein
VEILQDKVDAWSPSMRRGPVPALGMEIAPKSAQAKTMQVESGENCLEVYLPKCKSTARRWSYCKNGCGTKL